ncbi:MAG: mechanosensitive ion channel family protein [Chloroflexi bacterium]|nr:mechanosensitive ion channel family protein [Chloroflexota bacterium]
MDINLSQAIETLQDLVNDLVEVLPSLVVAIIVFVFYLYAARWIRTIVSGVAGRSGRPENVGLVLGRLTQSFVVLLGFLTASVIVFPNFSPAQVLQLLGISSVAIGFAFRDILTNFLAGIILLWTEPFRIGDQIVAGDYEGTVEYIQTRATMIQTYDGRRVVIPNGILFTSSVIVNTAFPVRRIEYDVGIGYGDDIGVAKRLIVDAIAIIPGILDDPAPDVIVVGLAEYTVMLRVRWWIGSPRQWDALDTRDQVLIAIKEVLLENGIDLSFPTYQVLFHDQTEETDGDRRRQREGWPAGKADAPRPRREVSSK